MTKKPQNKEKKCECIGCSSGERCTKEIRIDIESNNTTPKAGQSKEWEDSWEHFVEENELHGIDFSYSEDIIKSFITQTLQNQRESIIKKVEESRKRFRCATCDGAKCEHTMCCNALNEIINSLTENNE